jgi:hypothetical protein
MQSGHVVSRLMEEFKGECSRIMRRDFTSIVSFTLPHTRAAMFGRDETNVSIIVENC